jgi:pyruvate/2-oxoglutarate dehydrogenase complex dihydrolipoamide dehydrogenase (E3) component
MASCRELLPLCSTQERSCDTKHIVDADTKRILGAVLGPGDEIIHFVLDLIYAKAPPNIVMNHAMRTRPTVSEHIQVRLL